MAKLTKEAKEGMKGAALDYIDSLTGFEEREKFFDEIFDIWCKHCGDPHTKREDGTVRYCQCWNED